MSRTLELIDPEDRLRHCQHDGCQTAPTRYCSCGCDRQLCDTHEEAERTEWQARMGAALVKRRRRILEQRATRSRR